MAQKYHYYIGVQTIDGMCFVTKIDNKEKISLWDKDEKPLEMSMSTATDIAFGLCLNAIPAVVVKSLFEITEHFVAKPKKSKK